MITDPPIRILVVEDDAEVARGTAHLLEEAGYATSVAANGVEALQAMPTFRPNLVLSDRDMPEMDGMELCRRIKGDAATADVFVVLVSGIFTQSEAQSAGLDMGADGYIARPIANRELVARVAAFARILRLTGTLRERNAELAAALAKVKVLSGLLPICSGCRKIRDDRGYWSQLEQYVQQHSDVTFTHGLCPSCIQKWYPGLMDAGCDQPPQKAP